MADYTLKAREREEKGTPASRRLRRSGYVPANVYGGGEDPQMLALPANQLIQLLDEEAFFSSLVTLAGPNWESKVVVRDVQMHPFKPKPLHVDLMRVKAGEVMTLTTPIHLLNEEESPGIIRGGTVSVLINEVEVACLPKNIPAALEVDVSKLEIGDTLHLSDITPPAGVEIRFDPEADPAVVTVMGTQKEPAEEPAEEEEEGGAGETGETSE